MKEYEWPRAAFHAFWSIPGVLLLEVFQVSHLVMVYILGIVGGSMVAIDLTRIFLHKKLSNKNTQLAKHFKKLEEYLLYNTPLRKHELKFPVAMTWYVLGITFCYFFYSRQVALMSLIVLAIGDPFARVFGITFKGKKVYKKHTYIGAFGFFSFSMIALHILNVIGVYYPFFNSTPKTLLLTQILGSLVGMIFEIFSGRFDNLIIPISAGFAMSFFM